MVVAEGSPAKKSPAGVGLYLYTRGKSSHRKVVRFTDEIKQFESKLEVEAKATEKVKLNRKSEFSKHNIGKIKLMA